VSSARNRRLALVAAGVVLAAALAAWFLVRDRSNAARRAPVEGTGALGSGSSSASPFGTADAGAASQPGPRPAPGVAGRVPVAPGAKAWRFEPPALGDASAGTLHARLAQRGVDAGSARDAATFAEVMNRCRDRAADLKTLEREKAGARSASETERRALAQLEESLRETQSLCGDVPAGAAAQSDAWLTRAAELGDPLARYYYASGWHLAWLGDPAVAEKDPQRLAAYRARAVQYLNELASQGHVDSLLRLSSLYLSAGAAEDAALAWANLHAATRAQGEAAALARLAEQLQAMPADQRARAEKEATRIFAACCE
jgi:hypothetical protein